VLFVFPVIVNAADKFWFSNRIEFGYDKVFIRESFTVRNDQITRSRTSIGLSFKLSKRISYRTFYLLSSSLINDWAPDHQFGAQLNFRLK
jgi:hypothetical protein